MTFADKTSLRILTVEDRPDDAELVTSAFEEAGYRVFSKRVASGEGLKAALEEPWDLITSDHAMPSFSSRAALKVLKESGLDIPFILVSGSIGEIEAVELMRLGCNDYVLKDNLSRLVVSAERELREADNRAEKRKAEAEREQLIEELKRTNRMKDEFLATLSHELRTPLNVIIGHSELLLMEEPGTRQFMQSVEAIHRNGKVQLQLVTDLLDVSRIISGKLHLDKRPIEIAKVLIDSVEAIRLSAEAKRIALRKVFDPNATVAIGDQDRLQQVFWNLLTNAIKFTPPSGEIEVRLKRSRIQIQIEVRDSGIGIEPDFLPYVFDRFRQEDSSSTRRYGGLGLGLSIARNIVELHGGSIHVESHGKNQGTKFTVCLPAIESCDKESGQNSTLDVELQPAGSLLDGRRLPAKLAGQRILVVDDEEESRYMIARVLRKAGALVECASSAHEAHLILCKQPFNLLVSDIGMPNEDGVSLLRKIRSQSQSEASARLPAIALTAYAAELDRQRAKEVGFDSYLTKPVDIHELVYATARLLGLPGEE